MQLNEYISNSIAAYLKCERYINNGSPSKNNNTTSLETSPFNGKDSFYVYGVRFEKDVPISNIGSQTDIIPSGIIVIHPDFIDGSIFKKHPFNIEYKFLVSPTASGRTVFMKDLNEPVFLKLTYPKCLGRLTRHMGSEKISSACEVTQRLAEAVDKGRMNPKFSFLKEDKGRIVELTTDSSTYEWGMILRETTPYPYLEKKEHLMPFFSLFADDHSSDESSKNHVPFIKQFCEHQSLCPEDFVLNNVLFPLFDTYFDALLGAGIELEAHAQNMLVSFDDDFKIRRIVCRDLESAGRDITLMDRFGFPYTLDNPYKCNMLKEKEVGQKYPRWYIVHSFMFDFKLGEYIVSPLLQCCKTCFKDFDCNTVIDRIKKHNKRYIDQLPDFFPPDWCYYSNENHEQTGKAKEYIWESVPKYR